MNEIPEGTTHEWTPAENIQCVFGTLRQLHFYKYLDGWWVYSEITNWRKSQNPPEWFEEEMRLGFFRSIE